MKLYKSKAKIFILLFIAAYLSSMQSCTNKVNRKVIKPSVSLSTTNKNNQSTSPVSTSITTEKLEDKDLITLNEALGLEDKESALSLLNLFIESKIAGTLNKTEGFQGALVLHGPQSSLKLSGTILTSYHLGGQSRPAVCQRASVNFLNANNERKAISIDGEAVNKQIEDQIGKNTQFLVNTGIRYITFSQLTSLCENAALVFLNDRINAFALSESFAELAGKISSAINNIDALEFANILLLDNEKKDLLNISALSENYAFEINLSSNELNPNAISKISVLNRKDKTFITSIQIDNFEQGIIRINSSSDPQYCSVIAENNLFSNDSDKIVNAFCKSLNIKLVLNESNTDGEDDDLEIDDLEIKDQNENDLPLDNTIIRQQSQLTLGQQTQLVPRQQQIIAPTAQQNILANRKPQIIAQQPAAQLSRRQQQAAGNQQQIVRTQQQISVPAAQQNMLVNRQQQIVAKQPAAQQSIRQQQAAGQQQVIAPAAQLIVKPQQVAQQVISAPQTQVRQQQISVPAAQQNIILNRQQQIVAKQPAAQQSIRQQQSAGQQQVIAPAAQLIVKPQQVAQQVISATQTQVRQQQISVPAAQNLLATKPQQIVSPLVAPSAQQQVPVQKNQQVIPSAQQVFRKQQPVVNHASQNQINANEHKSLPDQAPLIINQPNAEAIDTKTQVVGQKVQQANIATQQKQQLKQAIKQQSLTQNKQNAAPLAQQKNQVLLDIDDADVKR